MEIDLLDTLPQPKRDTKARAAVKTEEDRAIARRYGQEFFDGDRKYGYGGYRYDGRWLSVAKRMAQHYQLPPNAKILDVGCAKGFLMFDFQQALPASTVRGLDVSTYARDHAHGGMQEFIDIGSAESLPYPDNAFDLAVSINSLHNLPDAKFRQALKELSRVSKHQFISVDAWHNEAERLRLMDWLHTAASYHHVDDWTQLFHDCAYQGDYWWFTP